MRTQPVGTPHGSTHDVVLVLMPYASVERPSVALSTLKAVLTRAEILTRVVYGNLRFADRIGVMAYESINTSTISNRIGEWTFAAVAFPDADLCPTEYLRRLRDIVGESPGLEEQLLEVRRLAQEFVHEMAREVLRHRPRIVGCSSVFQQQCASLALLRRIRELDPAVVTMLGGGNCEGEMGWVAHQSFNWIDYVVSGEAEEVLPDLCRSILESGQTGSTARFGPGVFGPADRRSPLTGTPSEEALYARVQRMDQVPTPDCDEYFEELSRTRFRAHVHPGITIETARGCWWGQNHHCSFCGISDSGMWFRSKPAEQILDELNSLRDRYGINRFVTADNIIEPSYFESLMPRLEASGQNFALFYQTKANLKRHQVETLAKAGVRWIQPGIESLDERVLQLLVKGASGAINVQLLKWARNYGVWVMWNMLFGAPGEDDAWYSETSEWLPLIFHLQPPAAGQLTTIRYNRFSPYFQKPAEFGLNLAPSWAYAYTYPHNEIRRAQQAYYFSDTRDAANSARPWTRRGVLLVNERIRQWSELFIDPESGAMPVMRRDAPVLISTACNDGLTIRDTRPCATAPIHFLEPIETAVYRACDAAATPAGLVNALKKTGVDLSKEHVADILSSFAERKLVLQLGGRILALAVDDPVQPYAPPLDFPAGLLLRHPLPNSATWDLPVAAVFAETAADHV